MLQKKQHEMVMLNINNMIFDHIHPPSPKAESEYLDNFILEVLGSITIPGTLTNIPRDFCSQQNPGSRVALPVQRLVTGCKAEGLQFVSRQEKGLSVLYFFQIGLRFFKPSLQHLLPTIVKGVKRQGHETENSLPASAEVKNT
jgi:hypothetical protein